MKKLSFPSWLSKRRSILPVKNNSTLAVKNNTTLPVKNSTLSPLHIHHILIRILGYLDELTLLGTARFVCARWYTLSRQFHQTTVEIDLSMPKRARDKAVERLPSATRLVIRASHYDRHSDAIKQEKIRLRQILDRKASSNQPERASSGLEPAVVPLLELSLGWRFVAMEKFLTILPSSTSLTRLRVHSVDGMYPRIHLPTVLHAYPSLVSLELVSARYDSIMLLDDPPPTFYLPQGMEVIQSLPPILKLESILIQGAVINQPFLEELLLASPRLKSLQLWALNGKEQNGVWTALDITRFVTKLIELALPLRTLAFSMAYCSIEVHHVQSLVDAYHGTVKEWGFSPLVVRGLYFLHSVVPNRVTSLKLGTTMRMSTFGLASGLHAFLCQSPLLLHLDASSMSFLLSALDPCLHYHGEGAPPVDHRGQHMDPWKTWACKDLQSLSLVFDYGSGSTTPTGSPFHQSRILFGYIARVLPKLRYLTAGIRFLPHWDLVCGVALLSRLQSLESIQLWVRDELIPKKVLQQIWDTVKPNRLNRMQQQVMLAQWKSPLLSEQQRLQQCCAKDQKNATDSDLVDLLGSGLTQELSPETIIDPHLIGTLTDVKMALGDLEEDPELERCWPKLHSIEVGVYQEQIKIRPTVEITSYSKAYEVKLKRVIQSRQPFRVMDRSSCKLELEERGSWVPIRKYMSKTT